MPDCVIGLADAVYGDFEFRAERGRRDRELSGNPVYQPRLAYTRSELGT